VRVPHFRTSLQALLIVALAFLAFTVSACGNSDEDVQQAVDQALQEQKTKAEMEELSDEQARLKREVRKLKRSRASSGSSSSSNTTTSSSPKSSSGSSRSQIPEFDGWVAQLGSYRYLAGARSHRDTLIGNGIKARIVRSNLIVEFRPNLWVVYAGPYSSQSEAIRVANNADNNGAPGAFARRATVR
jgi:cell division septation protein DedD